MKAAEGALTSQAVEDQLCHFQILCLWTIPSRRVIKGVDISCQTSLWVELSVAHTTLFTHHYAPTMDKDGR